MSDLDPVLSTPPDRDTDPSCRPFVAQPPVSYVVFDAPYDAGRRLLSRPLSERREAARRRMAALAEARVEFSEGVVDAGRSFFVQAVNDGPPRKTLASQLDRLDGILDGLDRALTGAVQDAVEQAVKQAVQAVLTEVLTNRELQEQLQQAAEPAPPPEEPHGKPSLLNRLWQAATENMRRTVQTVKRFGRGVGMALVAAGAAVAGIVYVARRQIASLAAATYRHGKWLVQGVVSSLPSFLPSFAFGG